MVAQLRAIKDLGQRVAPMIAQDLRVEIGQQIERAETPDGRAWQETQDGRKPLRNAAKALSVRAVGTTIVAMLEGPEARHHTGKARGGIKREILPSKDIPDSMARVTKRAIDREFTRIVGGR